jgi:hypothetical protein
VLSCNSTAVRGSPARERGKRRRLKVSVPAWNGRYPPPMRRERELLHGAVQDIDFELGQLMEMAGAAGCTPGAIDVACLESALLHIRNLLDFLDRGKPNYITVKDYLPNWSPPKSKALNRLRSRRDLLNAHLSHLTWDRVTRRNEAGQNPPWKLWRLADDILTVFTTFVARLQEVDAEMAEWFSGPLASASIELRGTWPKIVPKPASGSPLSVYERTLKRSSS